MDAWLYFTMHFTPIFAKTKREYPYGKTRGYEKGELVFVKNDKVITEEDRKMLNQISFGQATSYITNEDEVTFRYTVDATG